MKIEKLTFDYDVISQVNNLTEKVNEIIDAVSYLSVGDTVRCGRCDPDNYLFTPIKECKCNCHRAKSV